jgi:hypothetical protein
MEQCNIVIIWIAWQDWLAISFFLDVDDFKGVRAG